MHSKRIVSHSVSVVLTAFGWSFPMTWILSVLLEWWDDVASTQARWQGQWHRLQTWLVPQAFLEDTPIYIKLWQYLWQTFWDTFQRMLIGSYDYCSRTLNDLVNMIPRALLRSEMFNHFRGCWQHSHAFPDETTILRILQVSGHAHVKINCQSMLVDLLQVWKFEHAWCLGLFPVHVSLARPLESQDYKSQGHLLQMLHAQLLKFVPGLERSTAVQRGPARPWTTWWWKPNMFRVVVQQHVEKQFATLGWLQITLS